jgi:hypothetical protein
MSGQRPLFADKAPLPQENARPEAPGANFDAAERPSRARARRHLLITTIPAALFTAAYAGTIYWMVDLFVWEAASRPTYYAWRDATRNGAFLGAFWFLGNFLPVWLTFSFYGYWLRLSGYEGPSPRSLDALILACVVLMPWFWIAAAVRSPQAVLRNYKRRFRGETLYFMGEEVAFGAPKRGD